MADPARARKVADRIHETVARLLHRLKDPRLGFVTITDVRVTGDLQQATVFYTVYGSQEEQDSSAAALESARGLIRSEVGRALGIRLTPALSFQRDALPDTARTVEEALAQARERDRQISQAARGASYAGEADPYRHDDLDGLGDAPGDSSDGGREEPGGGDGSGGPDGLR
ncbi:30S ribosome-binding factor RbfA [Actinomyces wuliandei]|uniref:30S ribosome-binding factor RbfA n=1 Tax=Actinomyces wuliandei TaxID=2057743 RepID=UPI000FD7BD3E|nr:30S ribosome-binding factor RbfA [Actinomyces wuliandei]